MFYPSLVFKFNRVSELELIKKLIITQQLIWQQRLKSATQQAVLKRI